MWILDSTIVCCFCFFVALAASNSLTNKERFSSANRDNDLYNSKLKLRHHSHHPNLDRVLTKLENMNRKSPSSTTVPPFRIRHNNRWNIVRTTSTTTTTSDEGLFDSDWAEYDYDGSNENIEGGLERHGDAMDDENSDYEDEESFLDEEENSGNEWQAEEATQSPAKPVSSMTAYKWENYGTRAKVEESRRQELHLQPTNEQIAVEAVVEHYMRIQLEGQCKTPFPKVIPVQSIHPDSSKIYTPHCTILHRCAEDTGCCTNFATKCAPSKQVLVHLYFYSKKLGMSETKVEKLSFYNHTECECLERNKINTITVTTEKSSSVLKSGSSLFDSGQPVENIRICKCPSLFTPKLRYASRCSCECEDDNQACFAQKKGKEYFSLTDRKCIMDNECAVPPCEYGIYLKSIGRCQVKSEKMDSYKRLIRIH